MVIASEKSKQQVGAYAEEQVALWLKKQGYTILARNYRQRCGEIDLIATTKEVLSFIEVKYRTTSYFSLSEVITPTKQARIARTARFFLQTNLSLKKIYRFDVALVEQLPTELRITYIPNAFVPYDEAAW